MRSRRPNPRFQEETDQDLRTETEPETNVGIKQQEEEEEEEPSGSETQEREEVRQGTDGVLRAVGHSLMQLVFLFLEPVSSKAVLITQGSLLLSQRPQWDQKAKKGSKTE